MRLFVAVTPDEISRARITALRTTVEQVVGDAAEALRWVGPAEAHITQIATVLMPSDLRSLASRTNLPMTAFT